MISCLKFKIFIKRLFNDFIYMMSIIIIQGFVMKFQVQDMTRIVGFYNDLYEES